jgi:hypothetical protein
MLFNNHNHDDLNQLDVIDLDKNEIIEVYEKCQSSGKSEDKFKNERDARKQLFDSMLIESKNEAAGFDKLDKILDAQLQEVLDDEGIDDRTETQTNLLEWFKKKKVFEIKEEIANLIGQK